MFRSLKVQKKIVAIWSIFSILFNAFQPILLTLAFAPTVYAVDPAPIAFNSVTHSFEISSNPDGLNYYLYYQTPTIIENVSGTTPATVYAGTMSGLVGTPHTVLSGILKIVKNNKITSTFFVMDGNILRIVAESEDTSTSLSEADIAWLADPTYSTQKVTICHATASSTNPYNLVEVDSSSIDTLGNGNADHNRSDHQDGEDIIPPGDWDLDGRNWNAEGQAIWDNSCLVKTNLTVIKEVVGGTLTPADFSLHVASASSEVLGSPAVGTTTGTVYTLNPGTYTISEDDPTAQNYEQTSITCDGELTNTINLRTSINSTCTIVNTYVPPTVTNSDVTICKQDPNGRGLTNWSVALLGSLQGSYAVPVNGTTTSSPSLPLGNYVVKGYGNYKYSTGASWVADSGFSLRVPGQPYSYHSNSVNTWVSGDNLTGYEGALELKVNNTNVNWGTTFNPEHNYYAAYPGHVGTFGFSIWDDQYGDNTNPAPTPLTASVYTGYSGVTGTDGCITFSDIELGDYVVEESQQDGWENVSGLGAVTVDQSTENFTIVNRDTTQTNLGTITVDKVTDPAQAEDVFSFTVKQGEDVMGTAELGDMTTPKIFSLPDGTYSLSEASKIGWVQSGVVCLDGESTLDSSSLVLTSSSNIVCTFTNTKLATISGTKYEDQDGDLDTTDDRDPILGWNITLWLNDVQVGSTITDSSGLFTFLDLLPGAYQIRETEQIGWLNLLPLTINTTLLAGQSSTDNDFINTTIPEDKVSFCHATASETNLYTFLTTSSSAAYHAHLGDQQSHQWGEDIIPPFEYDGQTYSQNWDAVGQATYRNGCNDDVYGSITVHKEVDPDLEQSFTFNLNGDATQTADILGGSSHDFTQLLPGTYNITEVMPTGWSFDFATCGEIAYVPGDNIVLTASQDLSCTFYNQTIEPTLRLMKTNDASGNKNSGDLVTYTLTVEATGSAIQNVVVTDVPPEGFDYVSGSWTSSKSGVGEPNYGSPGQWNLGDMNPGDIVTLTYKTKIVSSIDAGTYTDTAWAQGTSPVWGNILDIGHDSTYVDQSFVGTDVTINGFAQQTGSAKVERESGDVLGAATSALPSTGANTGWLLLALGTLLTGIFLIFGGKRLQKLFMTLFVTLALWHFGTISVFAADPSNNLSVRIEQPSSPTRTNEWKLSYSVLSRTGGYPVVTCYVKKPGAGSFVSFGSTHTSVKEMGDNAYCQVNSGVMSAQGSYEFYVSASAGSDSEDSAHVTVNYDTSGPGTPSYYSKEHSSMCHWNIKFHTADDSGATSKVEIYSSDSKSFDTNGSTRVGTVNIGSNQDGTFTHDRADNCDREWYYVIRAFDSAGNQSDYRGDEVVITSTTTVVASPAAGAIVLTPSNGQVLGKQDVKKDESNSDKTKSGEVLGEESTPAAVVVDGEGLVASATDTAQKMLKNKLFWWVLAILAILGVTYVISRKKNTR